MEFETVSKLDYSFLRELVSFESQVFGQAGLNQWVLPFVVEYGRVFVLREKGKICGLAELIRDWNRENLAYLVGFSLREDYRRRGFGKMFLGKVLSLIQQEGIREVELTVAPSNHDAVKLYKSFNFERRDLVADKYGRDEDRFIYGLKI